MNIQYFFRHPMPWDVIKNNLFVFNHRKQHTIHHVTGHIHDVLMALIGVKTVLTIHDLVFLDNVKNPIKRFYKWLFWLYIPIKIADKVVCISTQTKHNILSKITTDKLVVIHNPVDPAFNFSEKPFNQEMPIILHIGTGWNKNLEKTIQALAGINCHLRIIGKLSSTQFKLLNDFNINFSNQCNLSDSEIKQEYTNCDIVNFPSKYEGFGMPIIEGQCTGRIVVTSNIEPIIEVANGAAVFISPEDVNSITTAYTKIIADEAYRIDIINRG